MIMVIVICKNPLHGSMTFNAALTMGNFEDTCTHSSSKQGLHIATDASLESGRIPASFSECSHSLVRVDGFGFRCFWMQIWLVSWLEASGGLSNYEYTVNYCSAQASFYSLYFLVPFNSPSQWWKHVNARAIAAPNLRQNEMHPLVSFARVSFFSCFAQHNEHD